MKVMAKSIKIKRVVVQSQMYEDKILTFASTNSYEIIKWYKAYYQDNSYVIVKDASYLFEKDYNKMKIGVDYDVVLSLLNFYKCLNEADIFDEVDKLKK